MPAVADDVTACVRIANVAATAPAVTLTLAGTEAAPRLLESVTTAPSTGAGPLNVTVPAPSVPPTTRVGFRVMELTTGPGGAGGLAGASASVAVFVSPLIAAEIVTVME